MPLEVEKKRIATIFAGGKSSRMKSDKSLLPFGEYSTLAEYQYRRLNKIFDRVYLSTKSDKFQFESNLIFDRYDESSPLVGLISIFETIEESEVFILSVDAPFVDAITIDRLYESALKNPKFDAIIAQSPHGKQPLCGIYRRSIIPIAQKFLTQKNHKLNALLSVSASIFILFRDEDIFKNLNHPHEYRESFRESTHNISLSVNRP